MVLIKDKANSSAIISTLRRDNGNRACRAIREQGIEAYAFSLS